jgi:hypothetical protein
MPVFVVAITFPNGNRCSRPVVAKCACDARAQYLAEHEVPDDHPAFQVGITQRPDPDGDYEDALLAAVRRRDDYAYWKGRR